MSENVKLPEQPHENFLKLSEEAAPAEPAHMQEVEAQMRRALGLFGAPRRQDAERPQPAAHAPRQAERPAAGAAHKRRFVQDGEVPVTVLHSARREHAADAPGSRLEAAEAAAATHQAARERAERALAEAHATIHDLQTKLGHAQLAKTELQAAAQREQETLAALRQELRATNERAVNAETTCEKLQRQLADLEAKLVEEQAARRAADLAREDAESLLRELDSSGPVDLPAKRPGRPPKTPGAVKPSRRAAAVAAEDGAEPVQWWLMPAKQPKRRKG
ncbi:MAG: hypothetical protein J0H67_12375 [Rhodospirillales bacterium]|nr:hypothetical protein [Rhodospirillales bacterium]